MTVILALFAGLFAGAAIVFGCWTKALLLRNDELVRELLGPGDDDDDPDDERTHPTMDDGDGWKRGYRGSPPSNRRN